MVAGTCPSSYGVSSAMGGERVVFRCRCLHFGGFHGHSGNTFKEGDGGKRLFSRFSSSLDIYAILLLAGLGPQADP